MMLKKKMLRRLGGRRGVRLGARVGRIARALARELLGCHPRDARRLWPLGRHRELLEELVADRVDGVVALSAWGGARAVVVA